MAKNATQWSSVDGNTIATQTSGGAILLENGSYLLLEDGVSHLLLEDAILTTKETTTWDSL